MGKVEERADILRKYYKQIETSFGFDIRENISLKKIQNARKKFALGADSSSIIGFYDTTIVGSGKNGYLFTDEMVYYLEPLEKPKKLYYNHIERVEVLRLEKKDCDRHLKFYMKDGTTITWTSCFLNKMSLCNFFEEILNEKHSSQTENNQGRFHNPWGLVSGGLAAGNYGNVNKSFEEEKFHSRQGHGFAAERANHLFDKLTGHDAKIIGDNNAKNGADRMVDGVYIQSKYCATGSRCINECFEDGGKGTFRYICDGKPMQIEVPSDKYEDAVRAMEEKIRRGQVKNVTDPKEARNIVRKGHFTYEQAKNIAKAGTVESLAYDAVNGAIIATSAFGVTALVTFASSIWNGEDCEAALKTATYSGLKVGGAAFVTSVIAGQLSKAGLNSALVGSSEAIVSLMGPKASAILVNAFRNGSNIYGAAAMKSAAKLLRGNAITAGVTVVVMSSFDIANIFRGRISGKQLFKNLTNTAATVASGTGGWMAGAAAGTAIFPGIGTIIGGLVGSVAAGAAAGKVTNTVLDVFIEDDADEMVEIIQQEFTKMAGEYLLNQKEAERAVDRLSRELDGKLLKDMFAEDNRSAFAYTLLKPIIEREVSSREKIFAPNENQMIKAMREVLEDISDYAEPA